MEVNGAKIYSLRNSKMVQTQSKQYTGTCSRQRVTLFAHRVLDNSELPSYDMVVPALIRGGIAGLRGSCKLTPGN